MATLENTTLNPAVQEELKKKEKKQMQVVNSDTITINASFCATELFINLSTCTLSVDDVLSVSEQLVPPDALYEITIKAGT